MSSEKYCFNDSVALTQGRHSLVIVAVFRLGVVEETLLDSDWAVGFLVVDGCVPLPEPLVDFEHRTGQPEDLMVDFVVLDVEEGIVLWTVGCDDFRPSIGFEVATIGCDDLASVGFPQAIGWQLPFLEVGLPDVAVVVDKVVGLPDVAVVGMGYLPVVCVVNFDPSVAFRL